MKKPKTQLSALTSAAKRLNLKTYHLHKKGESNLGQSVVISDQTGRFFVLSSKKTGHYPDTPVWFKMLCNSKYSSQKLLKRAGYQTIKSIYFDAHDFSDKEKINAQLKSIATFPVLLKPEEGFKGRGISIIATSAELTQSTKALIAEQKSFMLQEIVRNTEYRVLVVNNQVFAVHSKELPTVTGDGLRTITSLLQTDVPQDTNFIQIELQKRNLQLHSILELNQPFATHITRKGGTILHTKGTIPPDIEAWALQLTKDLNCKTVGIDVFIPSDPSQFKQYKIIEINASPGFTYLESRYGLKNLVREIAEDILKKYFDIT